jgi:predicted nucleic acid-binding protein
MEPYWHPVRIEQVIGRARRICSHKALPKSLQTVEVFVYLMIFTPEQLKSDEAIELKRKDLSKSIPRVPITSDQYLYEISEIKSNLTNQLTDAIKESAFDCYIYSNGKCVNFGDPTNNKFSYVPNYAEQQNDTTTQANKIAIEWVGKPITLNGVQYVYRRINKTTLYIYDKASYEAALNDPSIIPLQIGSLEVNDKGENVFKQLVN